MEKQQSSGELELAGINDAEISGYLCSQKEIQLKKLMWEILNTDYLKGKRFKKVVKSKKKAPPAAEKALKIGGGDQIQKKKSASTVSSKINYDALKKLMQDEEAEKSASCQIGEDSENNAGGDYYNYDIDNGDDFDF